MGVSETAQFHETGTRRGTFIQNVKYLFLTQSPGKSELMSSQHRAALPPKLLVGRHWHCLWAGEQGGLSRTGAPQQRGHTSPARLPVIATQQQGHAPAACVLSVPPTLQTGAPGSAREVEGSALQGQWAWQPSPCKSEKEAWGNTASNNKSALSPPAPHRDSSWNSTSDQLEMLWHRQLLFNDRSCLLLE